MSLIIEHHEDLSIPESSEESIGSLEEVVMYYAIPSSKIGFFQVGSEDPSRWFLDMDQRTLESKLANEFQGVDNLTEKNMAKFAKNHNHLVVSGNVIINEDICKMLASTPREAAKIFFEDVARVNVVVVEVSMYIQDLAYMIRQSNRCETFSIDDTVVLSFEEIFPESFDS